MESGTVGQVSVRAEEEPAILGVQDIVVLAVKAPALPEAALRVAPLLGPDTVVLPAMNGVPWWFFNGFGGPLSGAVLDSTDPGGRIAAAIPAASVIGCVIHLGASCPEPALVKSLGLRNLIIGEPSGAMTSRVGKLHRLLEDAGFNVRTSDCIQKDVWYKLWGNMTMNPLSAITGATMDLILDDPQVLQLCKDVMEEAKRIGERIGCPIDQSVDDRIAVSRTLGAFKTSMLQDVEAGKPIELDAIVGSVAEIGRRVGERTTNIDAVLGLTRLHAQMLGLYPRYKK
jgi:2-dehydropantoate 2-reductase